MDNQKRPLEEIAAELIDALGIPDEHKTSDLLGTPARMARSLREHVAGYHRDEKTVLGDLFDIEGPASMRSRRSSMIVTVRPISFGSMCAHHMLPFFGAAKVAYIPARRDDGRRAVLGLSKLARVVQMYAQRLTMQERIAEQVACALMDHAGAEGVLIIMRCRHTCMCSRGVRQVSAEASTMYAAGTLDAGMPLHVNAVKMLDPTPRNAV